MLKRSLQQMKRLVIPEGITWELIVIDNNSTDATKEIALSFSEFLPVRYFFEQQPGLSNARNRAVLEALGEYMLWTDDDGLVDPLWLIQYCQAFKQWPEAVFFGGPIQPTFAGTPPSWLSQSLYLISDAYSLRDLGEHPKLLTTEKNQLPYGTNYAVCSQYQRQYKYDLCLGVGPKSSMGGEEVTLFRRLLKDGLSGRWVPLAKVEHIIPLKKQTIAYLRKFYFNQGRFFSFKILDDSTRDSRGLFKRPPWAWRQAFEAEIKYNISHCVSGAEIWIQNLIKASFLWGQLLGEPPKNYPELEGLY